MEPVAASELSAQSILRLLEEAGIPATAGEPDGPEFVEATVGEMTFLIEPYAEASILRIWTAMDLEPSSYTYENVLEDMNRFNSNFLMVRNFIVRDPEDDIVRVVWDHDRVIGPEGLSSEMLASLLSRVATVIMQAFESPEAGEA